MSALTLMLLPALRVRVLSCDQETVPPTVRFCPAPACKVRFQGRLERPLAPEPTVRAPALAEPMITFEKPLPMLLTKPLDGRLSAPPPPAMPMAVPAVLGWMVRVPVPLKPAVPFRTKPSAVKAMAPLPTLMVVAVFCVSVPEPTLRVIGEFVVLTLPDKVRDVLPLVNATPPGAVTAPRAAIALVCVFKASALDDPLKLADKVPDATDKAPVWLAVPPAWSATLPLTVEAPRLRASASVRLTSLPETTDTAPVKLLLAWARVMLLPEPAVMPVVPVTARAPLWVRAPPVCRVRLPLTVEAPRLNASASVRLTLLPETTDTAPVKLLLAFVAVMFCPVAVSEVVPVTVTGPAR